MTRSATQYSRLAAELRRGIGDGRYPVGSLLPTEAELCRRYSISRITARAALAELQLRGLISRRPGVGTRVERADAQERFVHVSDSIESMLQFTHETRFKRVSAETLRADAGLAESLQCPPGQAFLAVEGLRGRERHQPLCLTTLYIPEVYAALGARIDGHRGSIVLLMEKMFDVRLVELRQVIEAASLRSAQARLLGAKRGEAALVTRRWHLAENARLLLASVSIYPHQRYSYALRMQRREAS